MFQVIEIKYIISSENVMLKLSSKFIALLLENIRGNARNLGIVHGNKKCCPKDNIVVHFYPSRVASKNFTHRAVFCKD